MAAAKVKLESLPDQIEAADRTWLTLKELREMVDLADQHGWADSCLVSHSTGNSEHPRIVGLRCATRLVVTGPA
jgi:hypothetical protein